MLGTKLQEYAQTSPSHSCLLLSHWNFCLQILHGYPSFQLIDLEEASGEIKEGERVIKTTLLQSDYFGIPYSALFHSGMVGCLRNTVRKLSPTFVLIILPWAASELQPSHIVPTCYSRCHLLVNTAQGRRECAYHHVHTQGHSSPLVLNFPWLSTPLCSCGEQESTASLLHVAARCSRLAGLL